MYQPTSTPSRACDEDLPIRLSGGYTGDIKYGNDAKGSKYSLHMLAEGCSMIWTVDGSPSRIKAFEHRLAAKRISLACHSFGNYHKRKFTVTLLLDGTWGIRVTRIS